MAISKPLRRLLHVLTLEEELQRRELESAQAELAKFNLALRAVGEQVREGRLLITAGVRGEDLRDRLAGQSEVRAGMRRGAVLQQHIQQSTQVVETLRTAFLEKRVERKQAETLVRAKEAREAVEENRRTQQSLDTWYLMRSPNERSYPKRDT
jgi:flagellar biosynthesis chaperone FliJ